MDGKVTSSEPEEATKFCVLPKKSVKLLAESVGIDCLSGQAAAALAEDVTYRIRQIVQNAIVFIKHCKRDHVTEDDINRSLFWGHVEPIYGYGSKNNNIFSSISTKDGDLFFHEDKEVNLRELAFAKSLTSLSELGSCKSKINVEVSLLDRAKGNKDSNDLSEASSDQSSVDFNALSPGLKSYYLQITKSIINADDSTAQFALTDLRDNPRVQIFLPYLVHFITIGIKSFTRSLQILLRLFAVIKALVHNRNLYLEPYVVQLVRAVMHSLIEKPASQTSASFDSWILRDKAAQTLCHIDRKCNNSSNYLHHQLLRTFKDIFEKNEQRPHCMYGAILGLSMLGVDAIEQTVFPHFKMSVQCLESFSSSTELGAVTDQLYVTHALKNSALCVFRTKLRALAAMTMKDTPSDSHNAHRTPASICSNGGETSHKSNILEQSKWNKDLVASWYTDAYNLSGDSFVLLIGNLEDFQTVTQSPASRSSQVFPSRRISRQPAIIRHVQNLIHHAGVKIKPGKRPAGTDSTFSVSAKRRRANEGPQTSSTIALTGTYNFLDAVKSEIRFNRLLERTFLGRNKLCNWRNHVGKSEHLCSRRIRLTKRKPLTSLSIVM